MVELGKNSLLIIGIILLGIYYVKHIKDQQNTLENFYGMNHIDHHKYLECCKHYGCNSWICQNYLYYVRPYMKYIGLVTSISFPQKIFSLFKQFNHKTSEFEYFYRRINNYYDYKFYKINLSGRPNKKGKENINLRDSISDGEIILIDGEEFIVNLQSREGIPYRSYVHKSLHGSRPHYGRFFGYNAVYDKYYPYLYKRPVHYAIGGGFKTTIAPYGKLVLLSKSKDEQNKFEVDLFEREMNPHYNEYKYYINLNGNFRLLPITRKLNNSETIELFIDGIPKGKYKLNKKNSVI